MTILTLTSLLGCTNKEVTKYDYNFIGENDLWKAQLIANGENTIYKANDKLQSNGSLHEKLVVTYKKDISELSCVKNLKISYESSNGGGTLNTSFLTCPPSEKVYTIESSSTGNYYKYNKDQIIVVDIFLDGQKQSVEMKAK